MFWAPQPQQRSIQSPRIASSALSMTSDVTSDVEKIFLAVYFSLTTQGTHRLLSADDFGRISWLLSLARFIRSLPDVRGRGNLFVIPIHFSLVKCEAIVYARAHRERTLKDIHYGLVLDG